MSYNCIILTSLIDVKIMQLFHYIQPSLFSEKEIKKYNTEVNKYIEKLINNLKVDSTKKSILYSNNLLNVFDKMELIKLALCEYYMACSIPMISEKRNNQGSYGSSG